MPIIGNVWKPLATFKVGGVETDPQVVFFRVRDAAAEITAYIYGQDSEVTRVRTGVFELAYTPTRTGRHTLVAIGQYASGAPLGASTPYVFKVDPDPTAV